MARAGLGEGWGEDPTKGRGQAPSHSAQGLQPCWGWGRLPTLGVRWLLPGLGLDGGLTILGSEQRRPRCVCRPEIKQMTFIGKAIFFPQCLSVRRIDSVSTKGCLLEKMKTVCCQFSLVEKKVLWRLMNNEPPLTMSGRPCSWLPAHNVMERN